MINKRLARARGFTLVETLIAILILSVSIAGPLTIASRALNAARLAKDQMSAQYLAQDAIEYIRLVRDTNALKGADWVHGTGGSGGIDMSTCLVSLAGTSGCSVDTHLAPPSVLAACPTSSGCDVVLYSGDTFSGALIGVTTMNFKRTIIIYPASPTNEAQVVVKVYWVGLSGRTQSTTMAENITNWQ